MGDRKKNDNDGLFGKIFWGVAAGAVTAAVVAAGVSLASRDSNTPQQNTSGTTRAPPAPAKTKKDVVVVIVNTTSLGIVKINALIEDPQPTSGETNAYNTVVVRTTTHLQKKLEHNKDAGHLVITVYYSNGRQDQFRIKSIFTELYRFESITRTHEIDLIRKSETAFQVTVKNPQPPPVQQVSPGPSRTDVATKYAKEGNRLLDEAFVADLDTNRFEEANEKFYEASFKFHDALEADNQQKYRDLITLIDLKIQGNAFFRKAKEIEENSQEQLVFDPSSLKIRHQVLENYEKAGQQYRAGLESDMRFNCSFERVKKEIQRTDQEIGRCMSHNAI